MLRAGPTAALGEADLSRNRALILLADGIRHAGTRYLRPGGSLDAAQVTAALGSFATTAGSITVPVCL